MSSLLELHDFVPLRAWDGEIARSVERERVSLAVGELDPPSRP